jgi:hypothetical protein
MTKIQVTSQMVNYALQQTSTLCAVALALRDANDDWILPRVTQNDIRYTDRRTGQRVTIPTPKKVAAWIDKFDRQREAVSPFSFDLDLAQATVRPIKHLQPSEVIAQAKRDKERRKVRTTQKKVPSGTFKNTNKRELRPVEVTGVLD